VAVFLLFPIPFPIRSAQDCPNCPRHQQHNTPKQTGKKRKKQKRKNEKQTEDASSRTNIAAVLSQRHRKPIDHDWKIERRVLKK
jgi:hypothetical protein